MQRRIASRSFVLGSSLIVEMFSSFSSLWHEGDWHGAAIVLAAKSRLPSLL